MNWLDVCGPPGSGKSTLADHFWPPHALPIENRLPPAHWHDFLNEITRLFWLIRKHPTIEAAVRMNNRSVRKVATVARRLDGAIFHTSGYPYGPDTTVTWPKLGPYIQTALAQRGLGFGWRLNDLGVDLNELRHFYRLMPVSIGVAVTRCPEHVVVARNHARKLVKETAHEDRAHMVVLMQPAIEIMLEVLRERGVPILEVDTTQPIESARGQLAAFAAQEPFDPAAGGPRCQVAVLSPPAFWWR